ncbi:ScbR family autoregulator-binding transcription factor [Streptomyces luteolus]|uniref:ScbR family autoregulator-binding transcription factor n=1 Tax=Streptomyces luteolus TaxID=3043615 RepID=A0ABT6T729_9ACTN|nr:ScbR family autoregulator-binding transcription factor [Streptomyces sp. B-S-A12]MDI3423703.1 ScbR family autoregulator-binding transcription factor [Streptomyces sp. B-S-A12]
MVKQERAARTRQSLIRAAAEIFASDGFAPASLATISKRAGVSNGALHFHFESKSALAQAVEDEAAATVRRITEEVATEGGSPLQELVDATHALMSRLADDSVVRAGFGLSGDAARRDGAGLRRTWQQWVEEILDEADRAGQLADGVSPDRAAPAIVAVTVGFEVLGGCEKEWLSEEIVSRFWELLLPRLAEQHEQAPLRSRPRAGGQPSPPATRQEK